MTKELIIVALILLVIYLYYQKPSKAKTYFELDSQETEIKELKSQLQQAQQLERFNGEQLKTQQTKIQGLEKQLASYGTGDWETKTAEVIKDLEKEVSDLTTERDEAIRDKKTVEQDLLATNNRLKNKAQEAEAKTKQIELLKKEKSEAEIRLNKSLTELKEKYCKQGKLLDEEQLECKKLEDNNLLLSQKIETLERTIQELKNPSPAPIYSRKTKKK